MRVKAKEGSINVPVVLGCSTPCHEGPMVIPWELCRAQAGMNHRVIPTLCLLSQTPPETST